MRGEEVASQLVSNRLHFACKGCDRSGPLDYVVRSYHVHFIHPQEPDPGKYVQPKRNRRNKTDSSTPKEYAVIDPVNPVDDNHPEYKLRTSRRQPKPAKA